MTAILHKRIRFATSAPRLVTKPGEAPRWTRNVVDAPLCGLDPARGLFIERGLTPCERAGSDTPPPADMTVPGGLGGADEAGACYVLSADRVRVYLSDGALTGAGALSADVLTAALMNGVTATVKNEAGIGARVFGTAPAPSAPTDKAKRRAVAGAIGAALRGLGAIAGAEYWAMALGVAKGYTAEFGEDSAILDGARKALTRVKGTPAEQTAQALIDALTAPKPAPAGSDNPGAGSGEQPPADSPADSPADEAGSDEADDEGEYDGLPGSDDEPADVQA